MKPWMAVESADATQLDECGCMCAKCEDKNMLVFKTLSMVAFMSAWRAFVKNAIMG